MDRIESLSPPNNTYLIRIFYTYKYGQNDIRLIMKLLQIMGKFRYSKYIMPFGAIIQAPIWYNADKTKV